MARSQDGLLVLARGIKAVVLDVDGVLTDASLYYGPRGEALKAFSARDGFAVRLAASEGIPVAVLSGRLAGPVKPRLADLGVPPELTVQGSRDKGADVADLAARLGLPLGQIAFMGDDLPDLPALARVGLAACPADAAPEVRERCRFVAAAPGGRGAVRELVRLLLVARGRWPQLVEEWAGGDGPQRFFRTAPGRRTRRA